MLKEGEEEEVATIPGMATAAVVVAADRYPTPRDHAGGGHQLNVRVLSAVALHTGRVTNQKKKIRTRQVIRQSGRR